MRINHNIQALNAYSKLSKNQMTTGKALEKLSSGLRINRAADDAAGLAISEKMRGQIRGLQQAEKNAMDGISLIQTAEGALGEVHDMLSRMRELAVQGANGTLTESDRRVIQDEIDQLREQIDRIGNDTQFNTKKLLNGSLSESADIRSLYGDVEYSKNGTGLRNIKIDSASVLPQDVYSLKVVTESKTLNMEGITDTHKTGLENFLLSPDSLLGEGEYQIALKSSMSFAETSYVNAADLDASNANVTNGKYRVEYSKDSKKAALYSLKADGTINSIIEEKTLVVPASPNDTKPQSVTFSSGGKTVSFTLSNPTKDAKIEFEKTVSINTIAEPSLGANATELDTTGSLLADGGYKVEYRKNGGGATDGVAKLLDAAGNVLQTLSGLDASSASSLNLSFTNFKVIAKIKAADADADVTFEKMGEYPGKVVSAPASYSNMSAPTLSATAPGGSYEFAYDGNGTATLKDLNTGSTITKTGIAVGTTSQTVNFGNGIQIAVTASDSPVSATNLYVPSKDILTAPDISKSTLEDGYYRIESDGANAYLYQTDKDGNKIGQYIDKVTNVGTGANTFANKKVIFTGEVGVVTFKQSTEYELGIFKNSEDPTTATAIAKKTSIHFGDEAIDLRDVDGESYGLTVDFTNAAAGFVKRGGALPEAPASALPIHSFEVGNLKRTSVILKDSTEKVVAHQFVDNDRKFIELGNTGISFGTGVLSHNEKATKIDIRQTLEDASISFQIGTNAGEIVALGIGDIRTKALGIDKFKLTDETSASNAIAIIDTAIDKVSEVRSKLGAYQNRMEHTVNNITQSNENLTAAESRIRDADMAKEMTEFTKLNIINQSATAMLAQANQLPQGILQLLKG